jgi:hypothetical protein
MKSKTRPGRLDRRRPGLEALEIRRVLSIALPAGISSVTPADGSSLSQSPSDVFVEFDDPGMAYNAAFLDVQIYPVVDGLAQVNSPVLDPNNPPNEIADPPGAPANGTVLDIPLAASGITLSGGTYQINVVGGSGIATGLGFEYGGVWNTGFDVPLAQFTVSSSTAITLENPTANLGTVGPTEQQVAGSISTASQGSPVDLYQFSLASGHTWQVGLSLSTSTIGSQLLPDLTLFNGQGQVIESAQAGDGLPGSPNEPYLFTGLNPGSYFVGISGYQNAPYVTGGYDPVQGTQGSAGQSQSTGDFELSLLAQPHDQATEVSSFQLDWADPDGASPTGLSVSFTTQVDWNGLFNTSAPERMLEVVDAAGHVWPTTAVDYQPSTATLTLIFDRPLPEGYYRLLDPAQGGLTDLAGEPISAPEEESGVLAAWTVDPRPGQASPTDLGVLWPASASQPSTVGSGQFSENTMLAPGQSISYRYVVTAPGYYALETEVQSGSVTIANSGATGSSVLEAHASAPLSTAVTQLADGTYELTVSNSGSTTAIVHWVLKDLLLEIAEQQDEDIMLGGVGSESALELMMITPAANAPGQNIGTAFSGSPTATYTETIAATPGTGPTGTGVALAVAATGLAGPMGPIPSSLLITSNSGLMGGPGQNGGALAPEASNSIALAAASPAQGSSAGQGPLTAPVEISSTPLELNTAPPALSPAREAVRSPAIELGRADVLALVSDDWLARVVGLVKSELDRLPGFGDLTARIDDPFQGLTLVERERLDTTPDAADTFDEPSRSAQADVGFPIGVLLTVVAARKLKRPLSALWRKRGPTLSLTSSARAGGDHRPHIRFPHRGSRVHSLS